MRRLLIGSLGSGLRRLRFPVEGEYFYDPSCMDNNTLPMVARTPVGGGCMVLAQKSILAVDEDYVHAWFVLFMFVSLIIISVFIAIILNYYGIQTDLTYTEMEAADFSLAWIKFDPDNTAYIPVWR